MSSRNIYALIIILVSISSCQTPKPKSITGMVTDLKEDLPLPGVQISINNGEVIAKTDFDGLYELMAKEGDTLRFNYLNIEPQQVILEEETTLNVQLDLD